MNPPRRIDQTELPRAISTAARLRAARRCLDEQPAGAGVADGAGLAPQLSPWLGDVLARSWQRSQQAGVLPQGRKAGAPHASAAQLARAMQRRYELISHAQPVMDYVGQQVVVHGGEHYLERNGFLSCSAAPIIDPAGKLMGAFDISGDQRAYHPSTLGHTLGLARAGACMVEHRLFHTWHAGSLRLRLHAHAEGLGTLGEGLLALAEDGLLIGANSAGLTALGLARQAIGHSHIGQCLQVEVDSLLDWALQAGRQGSTAACVLTRSDGSPIWAQVQGNPTLVRRQVPGTA